MKNFEERKAEIFRRSENRIKKRKRNRNRILALLIPLCLIVTVWWVTRLPSMLSFGTKKSQNEDIVNIYNETEEETGAVNSGSRHSFVSVDVRGTGANAEHHSEFTDTSDVDDVFDRIYNILIPYEPHRDIVGDFDDKSTGVMRGNSSEQNKTSLNNTKSSSYIITMTTASGYKRIFKLTDNKLYDSQPGIEINLNNEQINALKSALGLTE